MIRIPEFDSVEECVRDLADGKMIVLTDHRERETEGDLLMAAEKITVDAIHFMATHARGLICVALPEERADALGLESMHSPVPQRFDFAEPVNAAAGIGTGLSVADRARTIGLLASPTSRQSDFVHPGYVFSIRVKTGGFPARPRRLEGEVALLRRAGLQPVAVTSEIMDAKGQCAHLPQLVAFKREYAFLMTSVSALLEGWLG